MTHPEPPVAGDETATLVGSLERQRATFAWKSGGLDAAGLRATVGASSMTLGGLFKHLALVEVQYFSRRRVPVQQPPGEGLVLDPGGAAQAPSPGRGPVLLPAAAGPGPGAAVGHGGLDRRSRLGLALGRRGFPRAALRALAGRRGPFPLDPHRGTGAGRPRPAGPAALARRPGPSLRRILIDLIEEYAR